MLTSLAIRDVLLISRLDLSFERGLSIFTGETGAGKSILLESLGLALGMRAGPSFVRSGQEKASVTATFTLSPAHPVRGLLDGAGIVPDDDMLILRRIIDARGKSRAFINDEAVSLNFMEEIGQALIDIHGQFDRLLTPTFHRPVLDAYGSLKEGVHTVRDLYHAWKDAEKARTKAAQEIAKAASDADYLTAIAAELDAVAVTVGEEESLLIRRDYFVKKDRRLHSLQGAIRLLEGERGAIALLAAAHKSLHKYDIHPDHPSTGDHQTEPQSDDIPPTTADIHPAEKLETIQESIADLLDQIHRLLDQLTETGNDTLESVDDRLHMLRGLARKHRCTVDDLPAIQADAHRHLLDLSAGSDRLSHLQAAEKAAKDAYEQAAQSLSQGRHAHGHELAQAVLRELPALKLDRVHFRVDITPLPEDSWGEHGIDQVCFMVQTNPGMAFGPLAKIASGGEQSRLMLAIKVALSGVSDLSMVIFDEIDSGVGGAVASAIGACLGRLSRNRQVLAITHSPQVGAHGSWHYRVHKQHDTTGTTTSVTPLTLEERHEELARMLSGEEITQEARAAASRLLQVASNAAIDDPKRMGQKQ